MQGNRHQLRRLGLIMRLREIEHRQLAMQTHSAVGEQKRHAALASRAQQLAQGYEGRTDATCGHDLAAQRKALVRTGEIARGAAEQTQSAGRLVEELTQREMQARSRHDRALEDYGRLIRVLHDNQAGIDDERPTRATLARNLNSMQEPNGVSMQLNSLIETLKGTQAGKLPPAEVDLPENGRFSSLLARLDALDGEETEAAGSERAGADAAAVDPLALVAGTILAASGKTLPGDRQDRLPARPMPAEGSKHASGMAEVAGAGLQQADDPDAMPDRPAASSPAATARNADISSPLGAVALASLAMRREGAEPRSARPAHAEVELSTDQSDPAPARPSEQPTDRVPTLPPALRNIPPSPNSQAVVARANAPGLNRTAASGESEESVESPGNGHKPDDRAPAPRATPQPVRDGSPPAVAIAATQGTPSALQPAAVPLAAGHGHGSDQASPLNFAASDIRQPGQELTVDLEAIVDRLAAARMASQAESRSMVLPHPDFGRITLELSLQSDDRLRFDLPGAAQELRQAVSQAIGSVAARAEGQATASTTDNLSQRSHAEGRSSGQNGRHDAPDHGNPRSHRNGHPATADRESRPGGRDGIWA